MFLKFRHLKWKERKLGTVETQINRKAAHFISAIFSVLQKTRGKKSRPWIGTFGVKLTSYNSFHREKEIFFWLKISICITMEIFQKYKHKRLQLQRLLGQLCYLVSSTSSHNGPGKEIFANSEHQWVILWALRAKIHTAVSFGDFCSLIPSIMRNPK